MTIDAYLPAAQYLRMSTEHQQYSMDNQAVAIQGYANCHGFTVVKTYADPGRSGLVLRQRTGLRELLTDVMSGKAPYKAILVYDVSRWGRFQDADESAHYEFICKQAGVPVHYCAEVFENDLSLSSIIMKSLKRTMAAEYSRELSRKVYEGQRRLASLGFKQGGAAGYGLRRTLVSPDRTPKQELAFHEYKSIATDRVILSPGPPAEIAIVNEIYRMFTREKRSIRHIVKELNRKRIAWEGNKVWKYGTVQKILSHPKYCGCHVFGARTTKLAAPVRFLPKEEWVLTPGAFEPVVDAATFAAAQKIHQNRTIRLSNEELIRRLRRLFQAKGRLTRNIVTGSDTVPSVSTYRHRFGGLRKAYELVGFNKPEQFSLREDFQRRTRAIRARLIEQLQSTFPDDVSIVRKGERFRSIVQLGGVKVSIRTARFVKKMKNGNSKWLTTAVTGEADLITLLAPLTPANDRIQGLYLFRRLKRNRISLAVNENSLRQGIKLNGLADFCDIVRRLNCSQ